MDIKDVENLARLARIELTEDEKGEILRDMKGIIEYVKVIEEVEVENVDKDPDLYNVWRQDVPESRDFSRDIIVDQFPSKKDGFLKVKKIL